MSKLFKYESNSIWGLFITIIILLASSFSLAQEFPIYGNGLIYSPKTIKRLRFIADSLNVQYKNCIKNDWNSVEQTYGFHYYEDDTTKINKLILAIQNGNIRNAIEKILGNIEQLNIDTNLIIRF
ncbi:MAG: hypothetical protein K2Q22_16215, partial [Cytophagales bacterium]|nr:hypothetical protein [Cytophagales bacterium]